MEAPQHIAVASGQSSCDEARALPHPPIASAQEESADAQETKPGARDGGLHSRRQSPVAFGPWCQALLSQSTELTIGLVGQVHGSLSEVILLTDARSTRG